jgi:ADP-ribosylglycohydrolase
MNQDNAIGIFMGLAIGDALGGPLEFTEPNTGDKLTEMIAGRIYGYSSIPQRWLDVLYSHDAIYADALTLYRLGNE